jgi:hypothetical protein
MDKHLNMFYSYSQGGLESADEERVLEDNVTRALIDTLKHSEHSLTAGFLSSILRYDTKRKAFDYELQNIDDSDSLDLVQGAANKFVLGISPSGNEPRDSSSTQSLEDLVNRLEAFVKEQIDPDNETAKRPLRELRQSIRGIIEQVRKKREDGSFDSELNDLNHVMTHTLSEKALGGDWHLDITDSDLPDQLSFIYECLLGSRPDGWIWESGPDTTSDHKSEFAVLIENKIYGELNAIQLRRHIRRRTGLDSNKENVKIIPTSWKAIASFFASYKTEHQPTAFLVEQFKEYLSMTNIILDLSFLTDKDGGYERQIAREQFPKLLEEWDKKIFAMKIHPDLRRAHRPLDYLWDYYGIKQLNIKNKKDEAQQDPHYSVYFGETGAGIGLTTKKKKLIEAFLNSERLKNIIDKLFDDTTNRNLLARYSLILNNYRLVDYRQGQMKGETFPTFTFEINFSELHGRKDKITQFVETMRAYSEYAKQVELLFKVAYPDVSKIKHSQSADQDEALRSANEQLFKKYELLLGEYERFVKDTKPLFLELVESSK